MAAFGIKFPGIEQVEKTLAEVARRAGNLAPLMKGVAGWLESSTRLRFQTNLGPSGAPWKPSMRARLTGGRTLVEHGILRDSITSDSGDDFAAVGTNDPRGPIHQFGGVIKPVTAKALRFALPGGGFRTVRSVTMPARPFLGLSAVDIEEIEGMAAGYLAGPAMEGAPA